jgi:acetyl-CoA acetyltransferase
MEAYIVNGYRSAVGKAKKGGFRFYRPDDLASDVIKHLMAHTPGVENKMVDDLIVGNAIPEAEQGMQMGRMISLLARRYPALSSIDIVVLDWRPLPWPPPKLKWEWRNVS